MRLDHIAYRVQNRYRTSKLFIECFGYRIAEDLPYGFQIYFEDGSSAECLVLLPPEQVTGKMPWMIEHYFDDEFTMYHAAPEIFISDGTKGSIVAKWVQDRGEVGGIHHLAFQVNSVERKMKEWKEKGYAEFATDKP